MKFVDLAIRIYKLIGHLNNAIITYFGQDRSLYVFGREFYHKIFTDINYSFGIKIHSNISEGILYFLTDENFVDYIRYNIAGIKIGYYGYYKQLTIYFPVASLHYLPNLFKILREHGFKVNNKLFIKSDHPLSFPSGRILIATGDTHIYARVSTSFTGNDEYDKTLRYFYEHYPQGIYAINRAEYERLLYIGMKFSNTIARKNNC